MSSIGRESLTDKLDRSLLGSTVIAGAILAFTIVDHSVGFETIEVSAAPTSTAIPSPTEIPRVLPTPILPPSRYEQPPTIAAQLEHDLRTPDTIRWLEKVGKGNAVTIVDCSPNKINYDANSDGIDEVYLGTIGVVASDYGSNVKYPIFPTSFYENCLA